MGLGTLNGVQRMALRMADSADRAPAYAFRTMLSVQRGFCLGNLPLSIGSVGVAGPRRCIGHDVRAHRNWTLRSCGASYTCVRP